MCIEDWVLRGAIADEKNSSHILVIQRERECASQGREEAIAPLQQTCFDLTPWNALMIDKVAREATNGIIVLMAAID
jgi:hypothetical protein